MPTGRPTPEMIEQEVVAAANAWYNDVLTLMEGTPDLPHCEALSADRLFNAVKRFQDMTI